MNPIQPIDSLPLQMSVYTRWMLRRDMPEVFQVERQSFEYAWNKEDFLRCLRRRNCIGIVSAYAPEAHPDLLERQKRYGTEADKLWKYDKAIPGFMVYELHKNKLHILNFAVHPAWRRKGVGAEMAANLISKLSSHNLSRITLEVRETNLDAQLFFHRQGFLGIRVLRAFYEDTGEDAFLMEYRVYE